jgi:hypothetical protein
MTKSEFLERFNQLLELPSGTIKGDELLASLPQWDSIAIMGYIALAAETSPKPILGRDVTQCKTVGELAQLAGADS